MFNAKQKILNDKIHQYSLTKNKQTLTYIEVLKLWQNDRIFRKFFSDLLANSPFKAYRWETPPVTSANQDQPFEFILYSSGHLDRQPDVMTFAKYFSDGDPSPIVVFENLGKDATLVVPKKETQDLAYVHLASFLRQAPESQKDALWSEVSKAMLKKLNNNPLWLNTAGMGVAWVHIRLDTRPKYYHYQPYKKYSY